MMKTTLGSQGLEVPVMGLGCMGMTKIAGGDIYGSAEESGSIATIHRAKELGMNFLDTADLYGPLANERLIRKAIGTERNQYVIATKFGYEIDDAEQLTWKINGQPDYVRKSIERSLKNLGTDYIDLYYLHRVDPATPIEETVTAMAELVKEGKVRYLGLSEVSANTLRRAMDIHPISAVQSEYSLFERTPEENGMLEVMKELGVGFVAYSPLGRGFLTGELKSPDDFAADDFRKSIPRFMGENFYRNLELVKEIEAMAKEKEVSPSQLALAWTLAKGVLPIPGTRRISNLEANVASTEIILTKEEVVRLDSIVPTGASGDRYDAWSMAGVNL